MKITELFEDGVIVPGVNTTPDVKPGETERQAKKFFGGNGKPKPLGVKGATPNQAFNLGLAENMSVTGTERRRLEKKKGIKIGTPEWFKHWFDLPYLREDITRDELMTRLKDQQRGRYIRAMLDAMHKLVQSKGAKHSLGSYAFEIGKVFGFDSRELEKMYRDMYISEVNEAFDNPYPYTWDSTHDKYAEFGNDSFLAKAEMDMGELMVMFTLGKPGVSWTIDFAVDGAMDKTGDGDQFRIFATVVAVIKDWMANKVDLSKVTQIDFSSDKDGAAEDSRSKLYKRFGQQLASKLGWNLEITDRGQFASFKIKNPNAPVEETFNENVSALATELEKKYNLKSLFLGDMASRNAIELHSIIVNKEEQGQGTGSKVMQELITYADANEKIMVLDPGLLDKQHGTTSQSRLRKFYKRFGFIDNKGRNKNYEFRNLMIRYPQSNESVNEETGEEMLSIFQNMHHDAGANDEMDAFIKSHDWKLTDFTPDMFPSEEEFFDYDDPFGRVIDIDYHHRVDMSQPIIVGPQYKDGKYSVIDGNHRAAKATELGKTIKGYFPYPQTNVEENFADGKKKGKSRPGRVKRSGASCNGSVTELRAKAKKASGEKAKMYHWCANMKAGKKK